jgi:hypothetical protein
MADYTITLSDDIEVKAMECITSDIQGWIDNAATNRARVSKVEIIEKLVTHCNVNEIALAVGEAAQVTQALSLGVVETSAAIEAREE